MTKKVRLPEIRPIKVFTIAANGEKYSNYGFCRPCVGFITGMLLEAKHLVQNIENTNGFGSVIWCHCSLVRCQYLALQVTYSLF